MAVSYLNAKSSIGQIQSKGLPWFFDQMQKIHVLQYILPGILGHVIKKKLDDDGI